MREIVKFDVERGRKERFSKTFDTEQAASLLRSDDEFGEGRKGMKLARLSPANCWEAKTWRRPAMKSAITSVKETNYIL